MISRAFRISTWLKVFIWQGLKLALVLTIIKCLYRKTPTYSISKQYRQQYEPNNPDLIYGELAIPAFIYIVSLLPKPSNCKIYDLGCGDGKLVAAAACYFTNIEAIGIEKLSPLTQASENIIASVEAKAHKCNSNLSIITQDYLEVSFSDANIVYINGAALKEKTWQKLLQKFYELPKGSYVICVARRIESNHLKLIYKGSHRASWGPAWVHIYKKN